MEVLTGGLAGESGRGDVLSVFERPLRERLNRPAAFVSISEPV